MARKTEPAALGCRTHSGWAALVAIAGAPGRPEVIDRRRIEIADPRIRGSKQPYHAAEPLEFADGKALLDRCEKSSAELARNALREAIDDLRGLRIPSRGLRHHAGIGPRAAGA